MSIGEYCMNWVWYLGWSWKVLRGRIIPKLLMFPADSKFATITQEQFKICMNEARDKMLIANITYPEHYLSKSFDCENFACAMKHYFDVAYFSRYGQEGLGTPTLLYPYYKDGNPENGHCVLRVCIDGKMKWCEPYAEAKFFRVWELSAKEQATYKPLGMG